MFQTGVNQPYANKKTKNLQKEFGMKWRGEGGSSSSHLLLHAAAHPFVDSLIKPAVYAGDGFSLDAKTTSRRNPFIFQHPP
jgi:hypothetical protein